MTRIREEEECQIYISPIILLISNLAITTWGAPHIISGPEILSHTAGSLLVIGWSHHTSLIDTQRNSSVCLKSGNLRPTQLPRSQVLIKVVDNIHCLYHRITVNQMSVGPSMPVSCWALPAGRSTSTSEAGKLDVQWTATAIGRRSFAVPGREIWNSLPADLHLSTLSTVTFARCLNAHLFSSTEWYMPASHLIFLTAALFTHDIITIIIASSMLHN